MLSSGFTLNGKEGMGLWSELDRDKKEDTGGKGRPGEERLRGWEGVPNQRGKWESQGIGSETSQEERAFLLAVGNDCYEDRNGCKCPSG